MTPSPLRPVAPPRILIAIPVFNEERSVARVLPEVARYAAGFGGEILVIDDGSTDGTPCMLAKHPVEVIRHGKNRGYGRAMQDMLEWADFRGYDWVISMDCDEQHEPASLPAFVDAIMAGSADVVSGSRYIDESLPGDIAPEDRRRVNALLTRELNERLSLGITDAFCGYKAYRASVCAHLHLDVNGYDFPMQFWVQACAAGLRIEELAVRRIYVDMTRTFGSGLDEPERRLRVYRDTLYREIRRCARRLPVRALEGLE
ncbi:MAG: glycosyltransferase family 2 protein [Phycisphaerales bacterium]